MAQAPALTQGEEQRRTKYFRSWKGCFSQSARTAIPEDRFFYLENLQPIGDANLSTVPDISSMLVDYGADSIYWSQYVNLSGTDYLISLASNGKVFAYNLAGGNSQINGALTLLSGSGSRLSQWKNTVILFIDSTGYYSWDGATFAKITGAGVPSAGTDIAVFAGRVWIVNQRLLTFSAADDYTATAFGAGSGTGSVNLTDPTLRATVTRLWAQNGYLYLIGNSSVNAISDVYVPSGASPPVPVFNNINIQSIIGTDQPASVFALDRLLIFGSRYGAFALYGVSAQRLSTDIDGNWKYIDFTQAISGGQVVINNILTGALLLKITSDPFIGSKTVLAMYFDEKWWFANFGSVTFIASAIKNNAPALFGFIGNKLYQLFSNTASGPAIQVTTPLWPMEDPLADKQAIRCGFEATLSSFSGTLSLTLDTANAQYSVVALNSPNTISWINNSGNIVQWQNNLLQIVDWFSGAYLLYSGSSAAGYSKYIGLTIMGTAGVVGQLSSFYIDYKLRARW